MLFYAPRLRGAQNLSCASCHNPSFGYEVPVPGAIGSANTPLPRKAPTVLNAAFTPVFFWDGRAASLEEQAQGPITAAAEMNGKFEDILRRVQAIPEYDEWLRRLYPKDGATKANVLAAIATYERTVVTGWAPFDRWIDGDESAISAEAKLGFALFNGKAGCAGCHTGWNFTDNKFHNVGIGDADIGRGKYEPAKTQTQNTNKTQNKHNKNNHTPNNHAGQFSDLKAIIAFYETGGVDSRAKSPLIKPFQLSEAERGDLLAFLRSLTAEKVETPLPNLPN